MEGEEKRERRRRRKKVRGIGKEGRREGGERREWG